MAHICIKAEYGNCGPIKTGDDYCLFHKPDKNKDEAAEFYTRLKKQAVVESREEITCYLGDTFKVDRLLFKNKVDWQGYAFPNNNNHGIAMVLYATFNCHANFSDSTFKDHLYFGEATFKDDASFAGASFEGFADFVGTIFKGCADFNEAAFKNGAFFETALFKKWAGFSADFNASAGFNNVIFKGEACFGGATFGGEAYFNETMFGGTADFSSAKFEGEANFKEVDFKDEADFTNSKFNGNFLFTDGTFRGRAIFWGATIEGNANFREAIFKGIASFNNSLFNGDANFCNAIFERKCIFSDSRFGGGIFFRDCDFRQSVDMEDFWKVAGQKKYILPQAEQEGCRVQRIAYEKAGEKEAAEAMFVREMRARRVDRKKHYEVVDGKTICRNKPFCEKEKPLFKRFRWDNLFSHLSASLEMVFVDWTTVYGTSWQRVIVTALIVIIIFAGGYSSANILSFNNPRVGGIYPTLPAPVEFLIDVEYGPTMEVNARNQAADSSVALIEHLVNIEPKPTVKVITQELLPVKNFLTLLYFSAATFSTTGYGDLYPVGLMKFIAAFQSFLGAFFGALFVVVFSRKWTR